MYFQPHHPRTTTPNHPQLDSICDPRNQTHSSHSCSEEDEAMIVLEALQMEAQTTNDETEDTEDDEAAEAEDMFDADAPLMSPTGSHNSSNNNNNSSNNCIANNNSCGGGGIRQSNPSSNINFDNCNANVYCGQKAKQLGPITSGNQTSNCPILNAHANANANANPNPNLNLNPNPSSHNTNSHSSSQANANANPPPNTTNNITAATLVAGAAAAAAATGTAATSTATNLQQNQNISSSLEIILSPIIQSSRR